MIKLLKKIFSPSRKTRGGFEAVANIPVDYHNLMVERFNINMKITSLKLLHSKQKTSEIKKFIKLNFKDKKSIAEQILKNWDNLSAYDRSKLLK